jgi:proteic killer suppression protein
MRFVFASDELANLYVRGSSQLHPHLSKAYRRVIDVIAAAPDERTLRGIKGLRMEKLQGDREGQYSVRVNDQYRLLFAITRDAHGNYLLLIQLIDYH